MLVKAGLVGKLQEQSNSLPLQWTMRTEHTWGILLKLIQVSVCGLVSLIFCSFFSAMSNTSGARPSPDLKGLSHILLFICVVLQF